MAGLWVLLPAFAAAQNVPVLSPEYTGMVRLYASGQPASALALLGQWTPDQVRLHSEGLSDAVVSIRKCPACPTRLAFSRFPIRAALLLHADREIQEQFATPVSERIAQCGMGPNATILEHLAAILLLLEPKAPEFLEPLYLAMARQAQWSHCFKQSELWARAGLKRFPKDGPLLMAIGIAAETSAFFTLAPAPRALDALPSAARQRDTAAGDLRSQWEGARRAFEEAIAADPDLVEARLRLGRVRWRLGRLEAARASFETVLGRPTEPEIEYLAHLFLGRVLEDAGQWPEAEAQYRAARALQPLSETAAVALSEIRFLQGDVASARAILKEGLEAANRRTDFDPWVPYLITQTPDGERILEQLRRMVRP